MMAEPEAHANEKFDKLPASPQKKENRSFSKSRDRCAKTMKIAAVEKVPVWHNGQVNNAYQERAVRPLQAVAAEANPSCTKRNCSGRDFI